jgi:hypothetical protein
MIKGKDIEGGYTMKSMYDNDSIILVIKGEQYRIKADEIVKALKHHNFESKVARIHTYLTVK